MLGVSVTVPVLPVTVSDPMIVLPVTVVPPLFVPHLNGAGDHRPDHLYAAGVAGDA